MFDEIYHRIAHDPANKLFADQGWQPIYTANANSRIVIIGQAPGARAQESGTPWHDKSGELLRTWLGVTEEQFYDPDLFALIPMDFYYPGKGAHGDLPPRRDFAPTWHPQLLAQMPHVELIILIGAYSQGYCLHDTRKRNLTETVRSYRDYLPQYFPLVHPSPLNFRWRAKNTWFDETVVPDLRARVQAILAGK